MSNKRGAYFGAYATTAWDNDTLTESLEFKALGEYDESQMYFTIYGDYLIQGTLDQWDIEIPEDLRNITKEFIEQQIKILKEFVISKLGDDSKVKYHFGLINDSEF